MSSADYLLSLSLFQDIKKAKFDEKDYKYYIQNVRKREVCVRILMSGLQAIDTLYLREFLLVEKSIRFVVDQ